jgi:hypothetical protein
MEFISGFIFTVLFGRLLNVRPRIRKINGALVADTAPHIAVLSLGLKLRRVMLDPQMRAVRIFARYGWFFPRVRHIPFDVVECVLYTYSELNNQLNPFAGWQEYQEQDMFTVRLRLKDGEEPVLCRFYGQGAFVNNSFLPDWMFWGDQVVAGITQGSQESQSRLYATTVSNLLGVEIENR